MMASYVEVKMQMRRNRWAIVTPNIYHVGVGQSNSRPTTFPSGLMRPRVVVKQVTDFPCGGCFMLVLSCCPCLTYQYVPI